MQVLSIGEVLRDVFPAGELFGGASQYANAVGSVDASRAGATPDCTTEESLALASNPGRMIAERTL